MSKVNFVSEFNSIMRYARDNCLPLRERMLWIALFYVANDRAAYNEQTQEYDWPDSYIQVSNGELGLYCCLDKRGIEMLRNTLKQRGILDFRPGLKNKSNPAYKLNYLTHPLSNQRILAACTHRLQGQSHGLPQRLDGQLRSCLSVGDANRRTFVPDTSRQVSQLPEILLRALPLAYRRTACPSVHTWHPQWSPHAQPCCPSLRRNMASRSGRFSGYRHGLRYHEHFAG